MSGSIGGSRIPTKKVRPTVDNYIDKVLKKFPGYQSCDTTGSYNVIMKLGQEKKDGHGDIDLVVHIKSDDLKKTKKDFKKYLDSLPDELTPPFVYGNKKGEKSQLYGAIVTCGFPIYGDESKYVQVDNVIVATENDKHYQKTFLDLNAQKQALIQGLVRVILLHEDKDEIWEHFEFEGFPEPDKNQEYEFVCSPTGLSLRLITLTPERKEDTKKRVELWRSNNWKDVEWLLRNYDVKGTAWECLDKIEERIKDQRSRDRIVGIVNSMIRVGPGEINTPKGNDKQAFIDLCKQKLQGIKENTCILSHLSDYILEKLKINSSNKYKNINFNNMKNLQNFLFERGSAPTYKGKTYNLDVMKKPHVMMVANIIDQLSKKPDYKGKDKELWNSAGQFLYDYLKELSPKEYEDIITNCDLEDLRSQKELSAADVSMAVSLKLHK